MRYANLGVSIFRGQPRRALSAAAAQDAYGPINSYWQSQGLAHRYHTYDATLQEHYISPHQVLLDVDIDQLSEMESPGPRNSGSGDIGYWFVDFRGPGFEQSSMG